MRYSPHVLKYIQHTCLWMKQQEKPLNPEPRFLSQKVRG
jgi:hypothetical protein